VIAEVGNQFNGNLETAKKLAQTAKDAGADAVKYIFWFPDEIMAEDREYSYQTGNGIKTGSMKELLNGLRLSTTEWGEVKMFCDKIGIIMLSTVNCPSAYDLALGIGLPAFKLSSWDWNFTDLWQWCAKTQIPCIADLGAVRNKEMAANVNLFIKEKNKNLILLQCFHTNDYKQMNMLNMRFIADTYDCLVGYSAAGRDDYLDALSIGMGGCMLEKRLTLDRNGGVLHDAVSKEPDEFKEYVTTMRNLHKAMGSKRLYFSDNDWGERKKWFRRVVTSEPIGKGDTITRPMLECKRGETGMPPKKIWNITGKTALHDMPRNYDIKMEDVA
jgi:sialic acid synthase SpsE